MIITQNNLLKNTFCEILVSFLKYFIIELQITTVINIRKGESLNTRIDNIKNQINSIPELPGIYKMLDSKGNIIYIGKSKSLKKRVKSYFISTPKWEKIKKLVSLVHEIDFIVTDTHLEARLLECKLIKEVKPYFNSQMKNDQKYSYLKIADYNIHNPLIILDNREANSYGPFRSKTNLQNIINSFKNLYPISKVDNNYEFEYHIFPLSLDPVLFEENKVILMDIFNNSRNLLKFIKSLESRMMEAAAEYKFETASMYRDVMSSLNYLKYGIDGYRKYVTKNILIQIQIPTGIKLFYVHKSNILLTRRFSVLTEENRKHFIEEGKSLIHTISKSNNEKTDMDYRDILYSEIISLPDEMVTIL